MDVWETLGKKHAADVLIEIFHNPGIIQRKLADKKEEGSGSRRIRLLELEIAGLIRTEKSSNNWSAIKYYVTDEGDRISRLIIEIKDGSDVKPTNHGAPAAEGNKVR